MNEDVLEELLNILLRSELFIQTKRGQPLAPEAPERSEHIFKVLTIPSDPAESPKPCQITTGRRRGSELEARSELTFELAGEGTSSADGRELRAGRAETEERRTRAKEEESSMAMRAIVVV